MWHMLGEIAYDFKSYEEFENARWKRFRENVKHVMRKQGVNQTDLSRLSNISTSTVSSWLRGEKTPRSYHVDAIASALRVNPFDLFE